MSDQTQFELVQQILAHAIEAAPPGWHEMILQFYVEGDRSASVNSILTEEDGKLHEEALLDADELDDLFRDLQMHLAHAGKAAFTGARVHLKADGSYETHYTYEPVDWDALLEPDWNFSPRRASAA